MTIGIGNWDSIDLDENEQTDWNPNIWGLLLANPKTAHGNSTIAPVLDGAVLSLKVQEAQFGCPGPGLVWVYQISSVIMVPWLCFLCEAAIEERLEGSTYQLVQNAAAKLLVGVSCCNYIMPLL